jgi:ZIP family zinc transporter
MEYMRTTLGIAFIFAMTSLGAALVFFFKKLDAKLNMLTLGFASGVMIAAAFFGLLNPSISQAEEQGFTGYLKVIPPVVGMIIGCLFMVLLDHVVPHKHIASNEEEGPHIAKLSGAKKLFLAVTIHNIPEGLAVGFSFGLALNYINTDQYESLLFASLMLALGIGIQNLPEGLATALPIYEATGSKKQGFLYGFISGTVEPVMAVVGILLATQLNFLMPRLLAFSAGAMIFVTIEELIPEATSRESHIGVYSFMVGFVLMMFLDVLLG